MARDHARIRLDIWADDDFRRLPSSAQWLYLHLVTSPSLSFCGVADWRPARIAAITAELTAMDVEAAASYLELGEFIVVDRDSEEVLVRSYIRHDGLMKQPNMVTAMVSAHNKVASWPLRAVVIDQLLKLRGKEPGFQWGKIPGGMLKRESLAPAEAIAELPRNPFINPSDDPSHEGSDQPSATHLLPNSLPPISLPRSKKSSSHLTSEAAS